MRTRRKNMGVRSFIAACFGNILLTVLPIPWGPMRSRMVGRVTPQGDLEFYSHPNFVCVCHLIWIGWGVTLAGLYNEYADGRDWRPLPVAWLSWLWVIVLAATLLVLGLKFGRVACGFLAAFVTIAVLGVTIAELEIQTPISALVVEWLGRVPMQLDWGVPCMTSLVLGVVLMAVTAWQAMNDRWILPARGNYIEHVNFQYRDRSISKGAKSFVAQFDCLVRRYLLFGYGDIEVRSATGSGVIDRIEGVFFAAAHAEWMKRRFSATDVTIAADEELEDEEVAVAG